jgi:hypothetical protein
MLRAPWRSLGVLFGDILIITVSGWRRVTSDVGPLNTLLKVRPRNLGRVPPTIGGVNWRLRRRPLLTTEPV